MGRHRQPRELAILKGAARNHPERYRDTVPTSPMALGEPPEHLTEAVKTVWYELESYSLPGLLTGSDRFMLEIAATLLAEYRSDSKAFIAAKYSQLIGCLARLGLSPADRQKFGVSKPAEPNPFDQF